MGLLVNISLCRLPLLWLSYRDGDSQSTRKPVYFYFCVLGVSVTFEVKNCQMSDHNFSVPSMKIKVP